jgi:hypothetical protein
MARIREQHRASLFTSHLKSNIFQSGEPLEICDRACFIKHGAIQVADFGDKIKSIKIAL